MITDVATMYYRNRLIYKVYLIGGGFWINLN